MSGGAGAKRRSPDPWDIGFGAVFAVFAAFALLLWFPADIRGGFVEQGFSGRPEPGDAFFPVLLAGAILALALVQIAVSVVSARAGRPPAGGRLDRGDLLFLAAFHGIVFAGLAVMAFLGPAVVAGLSDLGLLERTYRQLIDTAPWKYLGFLAGGFAMTYALIVWAEGRARWLPALSLGGLLAVLVLVFDVLLRNVQLPPNADV